MASYSYYSSSTSFSFSSGDQTPKSKNAIQVPICSSPSTPTPTEIPVHNRVAAAAAAIKIQSVFRGHLTRSYIRTIQSANSEADRLERLIRQQATVDAIRRDANERARISEPLMKALLKLDAVPGFYPAVRELRRSVSRRIVGIQEVFDAIVAAPQVGWEENEGTYIPGSLEEVVARICDGRTGDDGTEEEMRMKRSLCWERFLWGM